MTFMPFWYISTARLFLVTRFLFIWTPLSWLWKRSEAGQYGPFFRRCLVFAAGLEWHAGLTSIGGPKESKTATGKSHWFTQSRSASFAAMSGHETNLEEADFTRRRFGRAQRRFLDRKAPDPAAGPLHP